MATFDPLLGTTTADQILGALIPADPLAPTPAIVFDPMSLQIVGGATSIGFYDGSYALDPTLAGTGLGAIGSGLILTTGTMPGVTNNVGWFGQDNGLAGDAQLDAVVNQVFQTNSLDATSLSFSFDVTSSDVKSISFKLVFGSEEYPEWVNQYVDIAGVFVNDVNYAYFDNAHTAPLSVIGSNIASNYFVNNADGSLPIQYDGVSGLLTVTAPVHYGTNTIKIAIADTRDHIYDSGIIISQLQASDLPVSGVTLDHHGTAYDDLLQGNEASENIQTIDGDDIIDAAGGEDVVQSGIGDDKVIGGAGNDYIDGDQGVDDVYYAGASIDYDVAYDTAGGTWSVHDHRGSSPDGTDTLVNVEHVVFTDGSYDLSDPSIPLSLTPSGTPWTGEAWAQGLTLPGGAGGGATNGPVEPAGLAATQTLVDAVEDFVTTVSALAGIPDVGAYGSLAVLGVPTPDLLPAGVTFDAATNAFTFDGTNPAYQALAAGQTQTLVIHYEISDGSVTVPAFVEFVVTGVNDAPDVAGPALGSPNEDGNVVFVNALANVTDPDDPQFSGQNLSVTNIQDTLPPGVAWDPMSMRFSLDPTHAAYQHLAKGESMDVTIDYAVTDGSASVATQVIFTVTGRNDDLVSGGDIAGAPVLENAAPATINLVDGFADTDTNDVLSVVTKGGIFAISAAQDSPTPWGSPIAYTLSGNSLVIDPAQFASLNGDQVLKIQVDYQVTDGTATVTNHAFLTVNGLDSSLTLIGTNKDDVLTGHKAGDLINGGGGNDRIDAGDGDDTIQVNLNEAVNDTIDGGDGTADVLQFLGTKSVTLSSFNAAGQHIEIIDGNGLGLLGTGNADKIDLSGISSFKGKVPFVDVGSGNDILTGSKHADDLRGNAGNDVVNGGDGNDTINGGGNNDTLTTGAGDDKLVFDKGFGLDHITDFTTTAAGGTAHHDVIDLTAFKTSFAAISAASVMKETAAGLEIHLTNSDTIYLDGVHGVVATDFLFA